jgi:hypothetical protein
MSNDETVTGIILARLERIEGKLDNMQTSGCAKAEKHERTREDEASRRQIPQWR